MKTLRIGERVKMVISHTDCRTGIITDIKVSYIVKQDDGLTFRNDAINVIPTSLEEPPPPKKRMTGSTSRGN